MNQSESKRQVNLKSPEIKPITVPKCKTPMLSKGFFKRSCENFAKSISPDVKLRNSNWKNRVHSSSKTPKVIPSSKYKSYHRPKSSTSDYPDSSSPENDCSNKVLRNGRPNCKVGKLCVSSSEEKVFPSSSHESLEEETSGNLIKRAKYKKLIRKSRRIRNQAKRRLEMAQECEPVAEKKSPKPDSVQNKQRFFSNAVQKLKNGLTLRRSTNSSSSIEAISTKGSKINSSTDETVSFELDASAKNAKHPEYIQNKFEAEISTSTDEFKENTCYVNAKNLASTDIWDNKKIDMFFHNMDDLRLHMELVRSGMQQLINHFTHPRPMELGAQEQIMLQFQNAMDLLRQSSSKFNETINNLPKEISCRRYLLLPCSNSILDFNQYIQSLWEDFEQTRLFINESPIITMLKMVVVINVLYLVLKRGRREFDTMVMSEGSCSPNASVVFDVKFEHKRFISPVYGVLKGRMNAMIQLRTFCRVLANSWTEQPDWDSFLPSLQLYLKMMKDLEPSLQVPNNWYLVRIVPETRLMRSFDGFMSEFYRAIITPDFVRNNPIAFGSIFTVMEYMLTNVISQHDVIVNDMKKAILDLQTELQASSSNENVIDTPNIEKKRSKTHKSINETFIRDVERSKEDRSTSSDDHQNEESRNCGPIEGSGKEVVRNESDLDSYCLPPRETPENGSGRNSSPPQNTSESSSDNFQSPLLSDRRSTARKYPVEVISKDDSNCLNENRRLQVDSHDRFSKSGQSRSSNRRSNHTQCLSPNNLSSGSGRCPNSKENRCASCYDVRNISSKKTSDEIKTLSNRRRRNDSKTISTRDPSTLHAATDFDSSPNPSSMTGSRRSPTSHSEGHSQKDLLEERRFRASENNSQESLIQATRSQLTYSDSDEKIQPYYENVSSC